MVYESEYDKIMLCYKHVYVYVSRQAYDDTLLTIIVFPRSSSFRNMLWTWWDTMIVFRLVVLVPL